MTPPAERRTAPPLAMNGRGRRVSQPRSSQLRHVRRHAANCAAFAGQSPRQSRCEPPRGEERCAQTPHARPGAAPGGGGERPPRTVRTGRRRRGALERCDAFVWPCWLSEGWSSEVGSEFMLIMSDRGHNLLTRQRGRGLKLVCNARRIVFTTNTILRTFSSVGNHCGIIFSNIRTM